MIFSSVAQGFVRVGQRLSAASLVAGLVGFARPSHCSRSTNELISSLVVGSDGKRAGPDAAQLLKCLLAMRVK
jgi:hypothetical protein